MPTEFDRDIEDALGAPPASAPAKSAFDLDVDEALGAVGAGEFDKDLAEALAPAPKLGGVFGPIRQFAAQFPRASTPAAAPIPVRAPAPVPEGTDAAARRLVAETMSQHTPDYAGAGQGLGSLLPTGIPASRWNIPLLGETVGKQVKGIWNWAKHKDWPEVIPILGAFYNAGELDELKKARDVLEAVNKGTYQRPDPNRPPRGSHWEQRDPATWAAIAEAMMTPERAQEVVARARVKAEEAKNRPLAAQALNILTDMFPYAVEFGMTGGLAKVGGELGKAAATRVLGKAAETTVGKAAIGLTGAVAGGAARAVAMPQRVAQATAERRLEGESLGGALVRGFLDTVVGNVAETSGETITKGLGKLVGYIGKKVPGAAGLYAKTIGKLREAWAKSGKPLERFDDLLKTMGYDGIVAEISEEYAEPIMNFMVTDQDFEKLVNSLGQTVEATPAMGLAFAVPVMGARMAEDRALAQEVATNTMTPAELEAVAGRARAQQTQVGADTPRGKRMQAVVDAVERIKQRREKQAAPPETAAPAEPPAAIPGQPTPTPAEATAAGEPATAPGEPSVTQIEPVAEKGAQEAPAAAPEAPKVAEAQAPPESPAAKPQEAPRGTEGVKGDGEYGPPQAHPPRNAPYREVPVTVHKLQALDEMQTRLEAQQGQLANATNPIDAGLIRQTIQTIKDNMKAVRGMAGETVTLRRYQQIGPERVLQQKGVTSGPAEAPPAPQGAKPAPGAPADERGRVHAELRDATSNLSDAARDEVMSYFDGAVLAVAQRYGLDADTVWGWVRLGVGTDGALKSTLEGIANTPGGKVRVAVIEFLDDVHVMIRALQSPTTADWRHEALHFASKHAPRSIMAPLEQHYGIENGDWLGNPDAFERMTEDMQDLIGRRETVPAGIAGLLHRLMEWFRGLSAKHQALSKLADFATGRQVTGERAAGATIGPEVYARPQHGAIPGMGEGEALFATRPAGEMQGEKPVAAAMTYARRAVTQGRGFLEAGLVPFREWAGAMIGAHGTRVKPFLADIYNTLREEGQPYAAEMTAPDALLIPATPDMGMQQGEATVTETPAGATRVTTTPFAITEGEARLAGLGEDFDARAVADMFDTMRKQRRIVRQQIDSLTEQLGKVPEGGEAAQTINEELGKLQERQQAITMGGQLATPEAQSLGEYRAEAERIFKADPDKARKDIMDMAAAGVGATSPVQIELMNLVWDEAAPSLLHTTDPAQATALARLHAAIRDVRGAWGRIGAMMHDPHMTPKERSLRLIADTIAMPTRKYLKKIEAAQKAGNPSVVTALWADWGKEIVDFRQTMKAAGVDLDNPDSFLDDRRKAAAVLRKISAMRADGWSVAQELYRFALLSGTPTHGHNFQSNTAFFVHYFGIVRTLGALVNSATHGAGVRWGDRPQRNAAEHMAAAGSMISRAWKNAVETWVTEFPTAMESMGRTPEMKYVESGTAVAIPGILGRIVRVPQRLLTAADDFAVTLATLTSVDAEANRIARERGFTGQEAARHAAMLVEDTQSPAWEGAVNVAEELTFKQRPGTFAREVLQIRAKHPWTYFAALPFVSTPVNIMKAGMKLSPFRLLRHLASPFRLMKAASSGNWDSFKQTVEGQRLVLDALAAGFLWAVMGQDDDDPWITGSEAKGGMPPYHVKLLGSAPLNYAQFEPFSFMFAMSADIADALKKGNAGGADAAFSHLTTSVLNQAASKTYITAIVDLVSGFGEAVKGRRDPFEMLTERVSRFASSWFPNAIKATARAGQETIKTRKVYGPPGSRYQMFGQRALQQTELTTLDSPKVDYWGREMMREGSPWNYPATDFLWRLTGLPGVSRQEPFIGDRLLSGWNQKHPNNAIPVLEPDRSFTRGNTQYYLPDTDFHDMLIEAGKTTAAAVERYAARYFGPAAPAGTKWTTNNPPPTFKAFLQAQRQRAIGTARAHAIRKIIEEKRLGALLKRAKE